AAAEEAERGDTAEQQRQRGRDRDRRRVGQPDHVRGEDRRSRAGGEARVGEERCIAAADDVTEAVAEADEGGGIALGVVGGEDIVIAESEGAAEIGAGVGDAAGEDAVYERVVALDPGAGAVMAAGDRETEGAEP